MIRVLKKLFLSSLFILTSLLVICILRYHLYFSNFENEVLCQNNKEHKPIKNEKDLIRRFSEALSFKTITQGISDYDANELVKFTNWIEKTYPNLHNSKLVKLEKISNYSLLYTIQGSDPNLKPYLLCSHLDVVPVEQSKWTVDPFKGVMKDGYLYGRGSIDVKDSLIGILESIEHLFEVEKFVPKRTILLAFGHDEEGSGVEGAKAMSKVLQNRYKELEYVFDEGSFIVKKSFPGINFPIAFVAVAEKGYLTVSLTAKGITGHSSMPPYETAITKLAKAVSKFKSNTYPSLFGTGPETKIFETLASQANFPFNYIYSNLWLFGPLINIVLSYHPMGNSLIRTTSATTVFNSGFKDNVLPSEAVALINHRLHPLDSVQSALEFDKNLINDEDIEISIYKNVSFEPHPISPYDEKTFGFNIIKKSVQQIFENTLVVPGIMVASTDTKHYLPLTKNIYRFTPIIMQDDEIKRFHGHDERIKIDNYIKLVNFYHHIILTSDKPKLELNSHVKDEL